MSISEIGDAIAAAERFLKLAKVAQRAHADEKRQTQEYVARVRQGDYSHPREGNPQAGVHRAAAKRASMDLTRALARYRK